MTHTYQLTGMTCESCESKVKTMLLSNPDISQVEVSKDTSTAILTMDKHISLSNLQDSLGGYSSKYQIQNVNHSELLETSKSWFLTYKPILLILFYLTVVCAITNFYILPNNGLMGFIQHFMAGFFLIFSFFKLLDVKGFAESYAMYDVIAKKIPQWGYVYAFIELGLGIGFLTGINLEVINRITLIVMSFSIIGVLQSVLNKRKIKCACLGAVFNLPISTVTIIEDALMILMSAYMIINM